MSKEDNVTNGLLSDITDYYPNIYEMTRDLAKIAKQIKSDTKEEAEPPRPVPEAIRKIYYSVL